MARVVFDEAGTPRSVVRMGVVLEPTAKYELRVDGGGCEDARVSYIAHIDKYVMTYTAYSNAGARIALALSDDLFTWKRLGLATFLATEDLTFEGVPDKDAVLFPEPLTDPHGRISLAMLHRPLFRGTLPEDNCRVSATRRIDLERESIWISYSPLGEGHERAFCHFTSHSRLAAPESAWERLKIGSGAPPVRIGNEFAMVYHGVSGGDLNVPSNFTYSAGLMMLDVTKAPRVICRSKEPILKPEIDEELHGTVPRVVFPTGIDRRTDLGQPDWLDLYYGMADFRIGVARIKLRHQS
ncbi:MAG: glycoside hydrolase family 130 protein [Candidatus Tyrphobacter sp.]